MPQALPPFNFDLRKHAVANRQTAAMMRYPKPNPVIYVFQEKCCPADSKGQRKFEDTS
ncbi:hypothetical protein EKH55_0291 [Sinorhizobium alkalisoli]|nr:hypothetical protein EKH55_0291 [Sinorhizobium alkalisoli]